MAWIRACGGGAPAVPDGKTITPINDVTIWQQCAGIANPTYTTLAEIFADNGVLSTLMASDNAVDYLVRSKAFIGNFALVPIMTSNTTPYGSCSASSVASGYEEYKAFTDVLNFSEYWRASTTGEPQWVQYEFVQPTVIDKIRFCNTSSSTYNYIKDFKIYGVNNSTPTEIYSGTCSNHGGVNTTENFTFANDTAYEAYRLEITSSYYSGTHYVSICGIQLYSKSGICQNSNAMTYIGQNNYASNTLLADSDWCSAICNSTYFESVLNVKVPIMTSNTTPSGQCFANSDNAGSNPAYWAFDGRNSGAYFWDNMSGSGNIGDYVGYDFQKKVKACMLELYPFFAGSNAYFKSFDFEGTDDSTYTNIMSDTVPNSNILTKYIFNVANYKKFRVKGTSKNYAGTNEYGLYTVQIYGREDV